MDHLFNSLADHIAAQRKHREQMILDRLAGITQDEARVHAGYREACLDFEQEIARIRKEIERNAL